MINFIFSKLLNEYVENECKTECAKYEALDAVIFQDIFLVTMENDDVKKREFVCVSIVFLTDDNVFVDFVELMANEKNHAVELH